LVLDLEPFEGEVWIARAKDAIPGHVDSDLGLECPCTSMSVSTPKPRFFSCDMTSAPTPSKGPETVRAM
jgi:hypothetical protein